MSETRASTATAGVYKSPWQQHQPILATSSLSSSLSSVHDGVGVEVRMPPPRVRSTRTPSSPVVPRARSTPSPRPSSSPPSICRRRRSRDNTDAAEKVLLGREEEASQEEEIAVVLRHLVESSTRNVHQHEQQQEPQNESSSSTGNKEKTGESSSPSSPPLPQSTATVFVGGAGVTAAKKQQEHKQQQRRRRTTTKRSSDNKHQQKEEQRATTTAGSKIPSWFLRFCGGCKSAAVSKQVIHGAHHSGSSRSNDVSSSSSSSSIIRGVDKSSAASLSSSSSKEKSSSLSSLLDKKKKQTSPSSSPPRRSLAGSSSTASSSSAAAGQQQPPQPTSIRHRSSRSDTRSTTQSSRSHLSSTRSSHDAVHDDDERRVLDPHESIVEALARRLEQLDAAESSAATSSVGGAFNHQHQHYCTSSQGMSLGARTAANSQAATQPIDNRQTAQLRRKMMMMPPTAIVKTALQPSSAVSSLAPEQSSIDGGGDHVERLLSTVEENLDEILSIPPSWSRPPPVEVRLNPNQNQQNLSLSLSASSESELEFEDEHEREIGGQGAVVPQKDPPLQSQPSRDQNKNKKSSSSSTTHQDKGQEVVADPSWYRSPETITGVVAAASSSNNIIKDSLARELRQEEGNLRHTNKSTADNDEPTEAAVRTHPSPPVKTSVASRRERDTSSKSFKESVEQNYMRLLKETKQGGDEAQEIVPETAHDGSSERGKDHPTSAAAATEAATVPPSPPPKQLAQQPPPPAQIVNNSSQSSTTLAVSTAAAALDTINTAATSTKSLQTELQEQLQLMQQPRPQQDETSSSHPPGLPHRPSRIESKLISENDDDGIEAVAVEDGAGWDVVQASDDDDADQKYQSQGSTIMSALSTTSCYEGEGGRSTCTEEEGEQGDDTNEAEDDDGGDEGNGSASKETSRRAKRMRRRKKQYDEIQRKRLQAAIKKTREDGWKGWDSHDEQKLASNVISWDSDSYNNPVRVSKQKKAKRSNGGVKKSAPVRVEPPVATKQDGWFSFNALMKTRSLDAGESGTDTVPSPPRGQRRGGRRSKRKSNDELRDDDFFSDTDSDSRPEQDLPLLIKRLTNQHFQKTVTMISREFNLSMSYPDDHDFAAHVDSDISSEYAATGGEEEEEDSAFFSHTDSAATSEIGSHDSFFTDEKKEMEDVDLENSSAKRKTSSKSSRDCIGKQKSGWSAASALGMNDFVCAPSREDILSMRGDSDA
jgi:hypothetical protein